MSKYMYDIVSGDVLPIKDVSTNCDTINKGSIVKIIDRKSLNDVGSGWLTDADGFDKIEIQFDFGGTYPIGEMEVWNYYQFIEGLPRLNNRGIKEIEISYGLDGKSWVELIGDNPPYIIGKSEEGNSEISPLNQKSLSVNFNNVLARYVKITVDTKPSVGNWELSDKGDTLFGLGKVLFKAGEGLAAIENKEWTDLFLRRSGWTGSDGIYSVPLSGREYRNDDDLSDTIFIFGDTFIGEVDPISNRRLKSTMINNSLGQLKGLEPREENIQFKYGIENGIPTSVFEPTTPKGKSIDGSYYWLQDGITLNNTFYCMPMIVGPNPDGPEGFEFAIHGVTCVGTPIKNNQLVLSEHTQIDTPLYYVASNGCLTYFGAGFFAQTTGSGIENPDEYIYVYGLQTDELTRLVVARVKEEYFTNYEKWEYWDGSQWSSDKLKVSPISDEISHETSVSYMDSGRLSGKYVATFKRTITGKSIAIYIGDTPMGPFTDAIDLYYCEEPDRGKGIYSYNAKAHPHLSPDGELLVSYNVNTTRWEMHDRDGSIYRPKFISIKQIEKEN